MTDHTDIVAEPGIAEEIVPIDAEALVDLIGYAGPGASIQVLARNRDSGTEKVGFTTWSTDLAGHVPAVLFYEEKPSGEKSIASLLPLGGNTVFIGPPRPDTSRGDRRVIPMMSKGNMTTAYRQPLDEFALPWEFEIIPKTSKVQED